jgi:hypothetical protein
MSDKKPPEGFDPGAPPQEDLEDPHLQRTSPYDVATLAAALGSVDDEQADKGATFVDFGPTERSVPFEPPPVSGTAETKGPDPRLFLDDTEVMPTASRPAAIPRAAPELDLPPPPVRTDAGELSALGAKSEEWPAPTGAAAPPEHITAEPVTSSVQRPVVTGTAKPVARAPAPAAGPALSDGDPPSVQATRDYEVTNAIPAEVSFSMAGQPIAGDTLQLPKPAYEEASAAPPSVVEDASEATTHVRSADTAQATRSDEAPGISQLVTEDASTRTPAAPAPVEEAFEKLEPMGVAAPESEPRAAPAPARPDDRSDEPTREMTVEASLVTEDDDGFAMVPSTAIAKPAMRPGAVGMAVLFVVGALVAAGATLWLGSAFDASSDATSTATSTPTATPTSTAPSASGSAAAPDRPPEPVDDVDGVAELGKTPKLAKVGGVDATASPPPKQPPTEEVRAPVDPPPREVSKPTVPPNTRPAPTTRRRAKPARRARSRTVFVVGVRDGSRTKVKGVHMALRSGFVAELRKGRRWRIGKGAPSDADLSSRLRLERLENKRAGGTWRVVASCTASLFGPDGKEIRRVRAVGGAHGERVTRKLTLSAVSACGEQVGEELRSSLRRAR